VRADFGTDPKVYYIPTGQTGGGAQSEIAPLFVDPERRNLTQAEVS
jgi:hypothetical protein